MAKPPKPARIDPNQAIDQLERPHIKGKVIAQIGGGFAILWLTAILSYGYIGYWGIGVVGVLTLVAAGFGVYIWRMMRRSQRVVDILKTATDEAGRKAAIERLGADPGDAINALARSQLMARDDPHGAIATLEAIDLKKAPAVVQDDVRANLGMLYLMLNRVAEARRLADDVRLDRQPNAKSKAMYAAVVAEAFARSNKHDEAKKLLETYSADDPEYGDVRALLLRAQVYTFMATKNRGLARKAMEQLAAMDVNALGAFLSKGGTSVDLQKMAREVLQASGAIPKQKIKMKMK